jgi:hypothetical protein
MDKWINPGRYVSGGELVAAGLAEMADLKSFRLFERNGVARESQKRNRAQPVREERPKRPTAAVNPQRGRT